MERIIYSHCISVPEIVNIIILIIYSTLGTTTCKKAESLRVCPKICQNNRWTGWI